MTGDPESKAAAKASARRSIDGLKNSPNLHPAPPLTADPFQAQLAARKVNTLPFNLRKGKIQFQATHRKRHTAHPPLQIGNITLQIGRMKGDMGDLKSEIAHMKSEIGHMKGEIGYMKGDMRHMKREIGDLKGEIGDLKGDMAHMKRVFRGFGASFGAKTPHHRRLTVTNQGG
jgi:HAMP domain-containing protein